MATGLEAESVTRWKVIEQYLPPRVKERVQEFRQLGCMSLSDIKKKLQDIQGGLHDPVWKFPMFHQCPNLTKMFREYVNDLFVSVKSQLEVFHEMFPNPCEAEMKVIGEISKIRVRIMLWVEALILNDETWKQSIRDMVQDDEMEELESIVAQMDLEEGKDMSNSAPVDEEIFVNEAMSPPEGENMSNSVPVDKEPLVNEAMSPPEGEDMSNSVPVDKEPLVNEAMSPPEGENMSNSVPVDEAMSLPEGYEIVAQMDFRHSPMSLYQLDTETWVEIKHYEIDGNEVLLVRRAYPLELEPIDPRNKETVDSQEKQESHSESKGGDEDDDIKIEAEYKKEYKPKYDRSLGAVSAFDMDDCEEDFADPESGEDEIPDYSDVYSGAKASKSKK